MHRNNDHRLRIVPRVDKGTLENHVQRDYNQIVTVPAVCTAGAYLPEEEER